MIFRELTIEKYEKAVAFISEMENKLDGIRDFQIHRTFKNVQTVIAMQDKKRFPISPTEILTSMTLAEGVAFIDTL
jgi:hypothetical protein